MILLSPTLDQEIEDVLALRSPVNVIANEDELSALPTRKASHAAKRDFNLSKHPWMSPIANVMELFTTACKVRSLVRLLIR